jgi:predicted Zn-dependent peptidase
MHRVKLPNNLTVISDKKQSKSVVIEVSVYVGSNNESPRHAGITHFVEHMLLEGTKKRPSAAAIAQEIEKLGGEINAATTNERTFFYVKVPKRHFEVALDVIADVIQNPLFDEPTFKKEKKVIIDEINLVNDEPRFYQWILFESNLFVNHPTKNPVYGRKSTVKSMSIKDIACYYKKYYVPNNVVISVVGEVGNNMLNLIKLKFKHFKPKSLPPKKRLPEPPQKFKRTFSESKSTLQSNVVLGYKTVKRSDKDSYVLDVIRGILGRGQSGKLFDELRNKRGLAYDVGVHHEPAIGYGLFAVYLSTHKKNIPECQKLSLEVLEALKSISSEDVEDAKSFVEGEFLLSYEDNQKMADLLAFWNAVGDYSGPENYLREINKVTAKDVARIAEKYLTPCYTLAIIKQKK